VNTRVKQPLLQILTPEKFPGALRNQATVAVNICCARILSTNAIKQWFAEGVYASIRRSSSRRNGLSAGSIPGGL